MGWDGVEVDAQAMHTFVPSARHGLGCQRKGRARCSLDMSMEVDWSGDVEQAKSMQAGR